MLDERIIQSARDVLLTDALDRLGLRWEIDPSYRLRGNPDTKLVLVNDQFVITITYPMFVLRRRGIRDVIDTGRGAITHGHGDHRLFVQNPRCIDSATHCR